MPLLENYVVAAELRLTVHADGVEVAAVSVKRKTDGSSSNGVAGIMLGATEKAVGAIRPLIVGVHETELSRLK